MFAHPDHGELFLNGELAGDIIVHGVEGHWGYGDFTPAPGFAPFAPLFGTWSLLMHADETDAVQSKAAAEELREAEMLIDALKAEVKWLGSGKTVEIEQLNIDGRLIEWKWR